MNSKIIAIDGPAGVGKSSVSMNVALKLGFTLIDTGAMYRVIGLLMEQEKLSSDDLRLHKLALEGVFRFETIDTTNKVFFNDVEMTQAIRSKEAAKCASAVAQNKDIRKILVDKQRLLAADQDVVMEGRDIGTVVFPGADIKIFLTARPEVRAQRRFLEFKEKNNNITFEEVLEEINKRDFQDTNRKESPLVKADDAIEVDTSDLSLEEVIKSIVEIASKEI